MDDGPASLVSAASSQITTATPAPMHPQHLQNMTSAGLTAKNSRQQAMVNMQEQQQDVLHASWQNAFAGYSSTAGSVAGNSLARNTSSRSIGSLPSQLEANEDDYDEGLSDSLDGSFQFDLDSSVPLQPQRARSGSHDASLISHSSDDTSSDLSHPPPPTTTKERPSGTGNNNSSLRVSRGALNKMSTVRQRLRQKNAQTIPEEELRA